MLPACELSTLPAGVALAAISVALGMFADVVVLGTNQKSEMALPKLVSRSLASLDNEPSSELEVPPVAAGELPVELLFELDAAAVVVEFLL